MKPITITPYGRFPPKVGWSVFVTTFATTWLFVEPLGFFGLVSPSFVGFGVVGYTGMLVVAVIAVFVAARMYRRYSVSRLDFLIFTVASSSDGLSHLVRAPANMQVTDFVHQFLDYLSKGRGAERVKQLRWHFEPTLQVQNGIQFADIENSLTLSQAGITEGNLCQIRGKPIPKYDGPMFSRGGAKP